MAAIRILIVEDHALFRSGLRALFEKEEDIEVVGEAGTGQEALRLCEEVDFNILTLDISLPDFSGMEVARRVLKTNPDTMIAVLTMHEDERYVRELFEIGVKGYVLKKSTPNELLSAFRALYRGESYLDPALLELVISPYVGKAKPREVRGWLAQLTNREKEVCGLLARGLSHAQVADRLYISPRTVESHRAHIMAKLELRNRADLVRFAIDNRLLDLG